MSYNSGVFSLFNQRVSITDLYADEKTPSFNPPTGFFYSSVYGKSISPSLITGFAGNISSLYAQNITATISSSTTISTAYGMNIEGPVVQAGTVSYAYGLLALAPGGNTIVNPQGAFFGLPTVGTNTGGVGIGAATPMNALDVAGGMAVGAYAGSVTVSSSILAVAGAQTTTQAVGIKTSRPNYYLDVEGTLSAGAAYGWMPLGQQQREQLAKGYDQGGFGGGVVGSYRTNSAQNLAFFDGSRIASVNPGYSAGLFDGRYIYYVPQNAVSAFTGQILRYDTTLPFAVSTSYTYFDVSTNINAAAVGFLGGAFDGTNLYLPCRYNLFSGPNTLIVLYNTTLPFNASTSYQIIDASTIQTGASGFQNPVFDGRYVYYSTVTSPYLLRYDTTQSFLATTSYQAFNVSFVNSIGTQNFAGVFDGRYIYFMPGSGVTSSAAFVRYDTTLPFSSSVSYVTLSPFSIPNNVSYAFNSGCFDGRYVYFAPVSLWDSASSLVFFSGRVLRYDTTLSFTSLTASYSVFNLSVLNSVGNGIIGTMFDGRYVWFSCSNQFPVLSGLPVLYDTTQPFGMTTSYGFFDLLTVNSNARGFGGIVYDGVYTYFFPLGTTTFVRACAYSGYPYSAMGNAVYANNGFLLGTGLSNMITSQTATTGSFSVPSLPAGYVQFRTGTGNIRTIPYY